LSISQAIPNEAALGLRAPLALGLKSDSGVQEKMLMNNWKSGWLGEFFSIDKGKVGIQSAVPGPYNLVTTGAAFSKHIDYHFEGEAICIPLISSTGHGDASLKRIHYINGKFAAGNILAACINNSAKKLSTRFVFHYLTANKDSLIVPLMKGSANVSLKIDEISRINIRFPDLDEQHAIVTQLDAVFKKTRQVEALLDEIEVELNALCRSMIYSQKNRRPNFVPMRDLLSMRSPDVRVDRDKTYHFAGVYSFGRGLFKSVTKAGTDFSYEWLSTLREGDFTYPKLMAWEGALGVVPPECEELVVSPEFPVFNVNNEIILPDILDLYFKTPQVWSELAEISSGTNQRRRRLQPSAFLNYEMPVPSMPDQYRLQKIIKRKNETIKRHTETRKSLKALLPSLLEKTFS